MSNEEKMYISELQNILDQCHQTKATDILLAILLLFVAIAVSLWVGMIGLVIFILVCGFIFHKLGVSFRNPPIPKEKLAYQACLIMDELIYINQHGSRSQDDIRILTVGSGKHIVLYNRFVELYPALASSKLKKLASTDVSSEAVCR